MDRTEQIARAYLLDSGFAESDVIYEPDGNIPPDFLVQGRIAVEVRRLNQNFENEGDYRGLEEDDIPLHLKIRKLLKSLGSSGGNQSFYFNYSFKRPVPDWGDLKKAIKDSLQDYRDRANTDRAEYEVTKNFRFDILPGGVDHGDYFVPGFVVDDDSGGWIIPELARNLTLVVEEKSDKTSQFRQKYPEWWLVLIDLIGFGLDEHDRAAFRQHVSLVHDWDRVILVDPKNPQRTFEIG